GRHMCTDVEAVTLLLHTLVSSYPQACVWPCPSLPEMPILALRAALHPLVQDIFPGHTGFWAPIGPSIHTEGEPHPATLSTTVAQDFRRPVDNPVHSLFVLVHGFCTRARKKFFRIIYGVIHRTTPKTVDNPVDNLWTSAICLWVTQGPPVDKLLGHRITKPRSAVDNPGEICG